MTQIFFLFIYSLRGRAIRYKYLHFRENKGPEKVEQLQISTKIPHATMQSCNYVRMSMKEIRSLLEYWEIHLPLLPNSTQEVFARKTVIIYHFIRKTKSESDSVSGFQPEDFHISPSITIPAVPAPLNLKS